MSSAAIVVSLCACARDVTPHKPENRSPPAATQPARDNAAPGVRGFAVYALSRGKGVPPEARAALEKIERILESDRQQGVSVTVHKTRIGIEGESKLCAEYDDPHAGARAHERAQEIARGVDLLNLAIEPCAASTEQPKQ